MAQFEKETTYFKLIINFNTLTLMALSTLRAVSRFAGYGMPWVIMVDSNATIGSLFFRAWETLCEISIIELSICKARRVSYLSWFVIPHLLSCMEALVNKIFVLIIRRMRWSLNVSGETVLAAKNNWMEISWLVLDTCETMRGKKPVLTIAQIPYL